MLLSQSPSGGLVITSLLFQWELDVLVAEAVVFFKTQSIPVNSLSGRWEHRC